MTKIDGIPVEDIVAIHQLLAHFGHVIDDQDWARLDQIVTSDFHFDARKIGGPELNRLEDWRTYLHTVWNPVAHHVTNIQVSVSDQKDDLNVRSKFLTVLQDGTCHTGDYHEIACRTPAGWRIRERIYVGRLIFTGDAAAQYMGDTRGVPAPTRRRSPGARGRA